MSKTNKSYMYRIRCNSIKLGSPFIIQIYCSLNIDGGTSNFKINGGTFYMVGSISNIKPITQPSCLLSINRNTYTTSVIISLVISTNIIHLYHISNTNLICHLSSIVNTCHLSPVNVVPSDAIMYYSF